MIFALLDNVRKRGKVLLGALIELLVSQAPEIVTVQVVKPYRLRSSLRIAYPVAMETPPALSHEGWEQLPPEAQAYIRALEARVEALEAMVQALQEQLNQTSQNSSRPP